LELIKELYYDARPNKSQKKKLVLNASWKSTVEETCSATPLKRAIKLLLS